MTEQINIKNVPADLLKQAKMIALEQDRKLSEVVRELLKEWVNKNKQKLQA